MWGGAVAWGSPRCSHGQLEPQCVFCFFFFFFQLKTGKSFGGPKGKDTDVAAFGRNEEPQVRLGAPPCPPPRRPRSYPPASRTRAPRCPTPPGRCGCGATAGAARGLRGQWGGEAGGRTGTPAASHRTPTAPHGTPTASHGIPEAPHGTPTAPHGTPAAPWCHPCSSPPRHRSGTRPGGVSSALSPPGAGDVRAARKGRSCLGRCGYPRRRLAAGMDTAERFLQPRHHGWLNMEQEQGRLGRSQGLLELSLPKGAPAGM